MAAGEPDPRVMLPAGIPTGIPAGYLCGPAPVYHFTISCSPSCTLPRYT